MAGAAISFTRGVLRAAFARAIAIYFREIEVVGDVPDARTTGRIFAANHVNGLVDPILVLTSAPCVIAPVAKSTLWKIPGLAWLLDAADAVPVQRKRDDPTKSVAANAEVFAKVAERLGKGGNILIFPEGTSHNAPHLAPLKTGAGRMLATARERGVRGLTFQAVGLEFDARDTFRSRALVLYGRVREVDALAAAIDAESLAQAITEQLRRDLSELVVEGASWDERRLIPRVAEMFAHEQGRDSLSAWNAIGQRVAAAKRALAATSGATHHEIEAAVARYYALLDQAGTADRRVAAVAREATSGDAPRLAAGAAVAAVARRALLVISAPLALVGAALYALPYRLPRAAARLAGADHDVRSTYKLGAGLVAFPLWAALLAAAAIARFAGGRLAIALGVIVVSPVVALGWLDLFDQRRARGRAIDPPAALDRAAPTVSALRDARAEVMARLEAARTLAEGSAAAAPLAQAAPASGPLAGP